MTGRGGTRRAMGALALAVGLGATLAGCSSGGPTLFQRIGALAQASLAGPEEVPAAAPLTRAELDEIPYAAIALSKEGGPRAVLVPVSDNGGYLNYRDPAGDAVVMLGGAISGTQSLGYDLKGVLYHRRDPIAHPAPYAEWPARVQRQYQYAVRDLERYSITLDCVFTTAARETIEVVELRYDLIRVSEVCTNARRQVTNTYWVDPASGFIWKSEQWVGPQLGHITVEIIRPYSG